MRRDDYSPCPERVVMIMDYTTLEALHPCFAQRKSTKGRMHLPVCPKCNIECRFCKRDFNSFENAPGVSSCLLAPNEAAEAVKRALELCPDITTVGIAGPGDTLATDHALETFKIIGREYPQLIKCMSTNGLMLSQRANEVIEAGIDSLTVTVNAVDPEIEARINAGIMWNSKHYTGVEAAKILIHNQLDGIRKVTAGGITVKVNTVLIPGINDSHIETVAKTVSEAGAKIYNIIPLIPRHELLNNRAPTCAEIDAARTKAEKYIKVFRHCQHCRADAVGKLGGEDFGSRIYQKRISTELTFSHG
jgi:nitrogen fixation protein NifB